MGTSVPQPKVPDIKVNVLKVKACETMCSENNMQNIHIDILTDVEFLVNDTEYN